MSSGDLVARRALDPRTRFYSAMAAVAAIVAVVGFAKTFFAPVAMGRFAAPAVVWVHGAACFAWIAAFVAQPILVRRRMLAAHRSLGFAAASIAVVIAVTGVGAQVHATAREIAAGGGETAVSSIVGTCTAMVAFLSFVLAGIVFRTRPDTHRRLMLLATLALLWPAWFRFRHYFPGVPNPEIWFAVVAADALIVVAALRDRIVLGRVHPAYAWGGGALIADHVAESLLFDTPPWRAVAHALWSVLG